MIEIEATKDGEEPALTEDELLEIAREETGPLDIIGTLFSVENKAQTLGEMRDVLTKYWRSEKDEGKRKFLASCLKAIIKITETYSGDTLTVETILAEQTDRMADFYINAAYPADYFDQWIFKKIPREELAKTVTAFETVKTNKK